MFSNVAMFAGDVTRPYTTVVVSERLSVYVSVSVVQ